MIWRNIPAGQGLFTEKFSIMNLGVIREFEARSISSYQMNITTILFRME